MRSYSFAFRLSVLAVLILASTLAGAWKWELVLH
jgi:hypothetical protein